MSVTARKFRSERGIERVRLRQRDYYLATRLSH